MIFVKLKQPSIKASLVQQLLKEQFTSMEQLLLRIMIRNILMIGPEVHFCWRIVITFPTIEIQDPLKGKVTH